MSDEGKLFVGGLSFNTDEQSLEEVFSEYGQISEVRVIKDRDTQQSRGFGFITFENPGDAKDALAAMNGKSIDGRQIRVDQAEKKSGGGGGGNMRGGYRRPSGGYGGGGGGYGGGFGGGASFYSSGRSGYGGSNQYNSSGGGGRSDSYSGPRGRGYGGYGYSGNRSGQYDKY